MKKLLKYLKKYKINLVVGPILKLLEAIIEVLLPIIIAYFIDNYQNFSTEELMNYSILLIILVTFGLIFACTAQYIAARTSQGYSKILREKLFSHIQKIPANKLSSIGSSAVVNRIINDVTNLETGIAMFIRLVIRVPFIFIGSIVMISIINIKIAINVLIASIILFAIIIIIARFASKIYQKANLFLDKLTLKIKENLVNVKLIRSFVKQNSEKCKFEEINNSTYVYTKIANVLSFILNPISIFILNITTLIVLNISNVEFNIGNLTKGDSIAVINYISEMLLAVVVLSNLVTIYTRCFASSKRILELLNIEEDKESGNLREFKNISNIIDMKNVNFSYFNDSTKPNLKNISLDISTGEIVGIIGLTGSGKSTFLKLLNNSLHITSGTLKLFGEEINKYSSTFLKEYTTYIGQKPDFITDTIFENISLGRTTNEEEIKRSLDLSFSSEFVKKLPNTINFILKNNATNLSGGQKQRINIARGFIGKPKILIFDDVTSALDLYTESQVLKNIFDYTKSNNITTFISSQKTSTVKNCSKIIVFNNGEIENIGTHNELLKNSELYKKIYELQNSNTKGV